MAESTTGRNEGEAVLMLHENARFADAVVHVTGHHYRQCEFVRCTMVVKEAGRGGFSDCRFDACVWHLDVVFSDLAQWQTFLRSIGHLMEGTLPRAQGNGSVPFGDTPVSGKPGGGPH